MQLCGLWSPMRKSPGTLLAHLDMNSQTDLTCPEILSRELVFKPTWFSCVRPRASTCIVSPRVKRAAPAGRGECAL